MPVFTRTTKNLIIKIDEFFDNIDLGLLVFREGIKAYLERIWKLSGDIFRKLNPSRTMPINFSVPLKMR